MFSIVTAKSKGINSNCVLKTRVNDIHVGCCILLILAGCLSVKVVDMETKGDFDLYRLSLESIEEQESDTVLLYHFRDWPRHAVPNNGLHGITNMYQEVMRSNINQPTVDTVRKCISVSLLDL